MATTCPSSSGTRGMSARWSTAAATSSSVRGQPPPASLPSRRYSTFHAAQPRPARSSHSARVWWRPCWAAWNVEYRRLGRLAGGGWPRTLEDVAAAVDHLADIPGGPLERGHVVAIGHSAGGHLAAWLATRPVARVPVTRVVAQAGVVDLRLASELRLSDRVVHRFLGGTPEEVPERYAAASPAERLPLGVPVLLVHGEDDETVPPLMSERFAAAAGAAGDRVELELVAGEGHMGHLDPANPLWAPVAAWLG